MEFIRTQINDSAKTIIVIEKTKNGLTKKIYNSLLDMPEFERNAYIAQAFANIEMPHNPEEMWARQQLEKMLALKIAKSAHVK